MDPAKRGRKGSFRKTTGGSPSRKNSNTRLGGSQRSPSTSKLQSQQESPNSGTSEDSEIETTNNNTTSTTNEETINESTQNSESNGTTTTTTTTNEPTAPSPTTKLTKAQQQKERDKFATAPVKSNSKATNVDELSKRTSQVLQHKDPVSMSSVHASPRHTRSVSPGRVQGKNLFAFKKKKKNEKEKILFRFFFFLISF